MTQSPSGTHDISDIFRLWKVLNVRVRRAWFDIVKMPPVTVIDEASPPHTKVVALLRYDLKYVYVSLTPLPSLKENHYDDCSHHGDLVSLEM